MQAEKLADRQLVFDDERPARFIIWIHRSDSQLGRETRAAAIWSSLPGQGLWRRQSVSFPFEW